MLTKKSTIVWHEFILLLQKQILKNFNLYFITLNPYLKSKSFVFCVTIEKLFNSYNIQTFKGIGRET